MSGPRQCEDGRAVQAAVRASAAGRAGIVAEVDGFLRMFAADPPSDPWRMTFLNHLLELRSALTGGGET